MDTLLDAVPVISDFVYKNLILW